MRYVTTEDLDEIVSADAVQILADRLESIRTAKKRVLAENDAKMVLSVYGKRKELG